MPLPSKAVFKRLKDWTRLAQRAGVPLCDLSMINPDIPPPREMLDRLVESVVKPQSHRYASSLGYRKLREAFVEKYRTRFGVPLPSIDHVCITAGTKDANLNVYGYFAERGFSSLLLPSPTYPPLFYAAKLNGISSIVFYDAEGGEERLVSSLCDEIRRSPQSLVVLNTPSNPTGLVLGSQALRQIVECARQYSCTVFNDFVYGELAFHGSKPPSLLSVEGANGDFTSLIEVYSLSKAYSVPGWRIAALLGCREIVAQVAERKSIADYGVFTPLQVGAAAGLRSCEGGTRTAAKEYESRHHLMQEALQSLGFAVSPAQAGSSLWAKLPADLLEAPQVEAPQVEAPPVEAPPVVAREEVLAPAESFVRALIEKSGFVLLPGTVFGEEWGGYVRVALVRPPEVLETCCSRIGELVRAGCLS